MNSKIQWVRLGEDDSTVLPMTEVKERAIKGKRLKRVNL